MVNSIKRLNSMQAFLCGKFEPWNCRAGQNSLILWVDDSPESHFPLCLASDKLETIENHNSAFPQLNGMKKSCLAHCFSTLDRTLGFCYNDSRVIKLVFQQATHGFQGVTGSFT